MPNRRKTHRVKTPWKQKRYTLRRSQRGGRFVGSGTYGCGFRPALRCHGEARRRRGKFAKLVHRTTADEELVLSNILRPLDPERQYFLYPEAVCSPAPFEASDEVVKCQLVFEPENPARVIIMGKGGENLEKLSLRPRDYFPFFESLANVFRGLALLNANNLAHMDAKPPNLVTRRHADGSFHTRLIDFGLMIDPTRLDAWASIEDGTFDEYSVLDTNYLYWPFEVRFLKPGMIDKAIAQHIDMQVELARFYRIFASTRLNVPYELFGARKLTRPNVAALAGPLAPMAAAPRYAAIIRKADVHGFGVSLAQIYYRFTGHRDTGAADGPSIAVKASPPAAVPADSKKLSPPVIPTLVSALAPSANLSAAAIAWHQGLAEHVSIPLYALVRDMTHPQPALRPTMEEALARYEAILPQMAEELTPANITMAIKSWMLDKDTLVEGPTPVAGAAAGGAGAAAVMSSSSEVPPSPSPGAAAARVPAPRSSQVVPNLAEGGSEENIASYISSNSNDRSSPTPRGGRIFDVSSSTQRTSSSGSKNWESYEMNSEELRRQHENFINSHFVKRY